MLTADDHGWLKSLTSEALSAEDAKTLVYARQTGAVDNAACRDFSGLDTLQASGVLRRLRDRGLLEKQGGGSRTYYTLASAGERTTAAAYSHKLDANPHNLQRYSHNLGSKSPRAPPEIDEELRRRIEAAGARPRRAILRPLILELCSLRPFSAAELCEVMGRRDPRELTRDHLKPLRMEGQLDLLYPGERKPSESGVHDQAPATASVAAMGSRSNIEWTEMT